MASVLVPYTLGMVRYGRSMDMQFSFRLTPSIHPSIHLPVRPQRHVKFLVLVPVPVLVLGITERTAVIYLHGLGWVVEL